jgi:hypothetical protein
LVAVGGCLSIPPFESLFTVFQQRLIAGEVTFEMFLCQLIIFTPLVIMFSTDGWALFVDTATAITLKEVATVVDDQKPAIFILIELYLLMGNLPEQGLEVGLATGGVNLLGKVATAGCSTTEATFVISGDVNLAH